MPANTSVTVGRVRIIPSRRLGRRLIGEQAGFSLIELLVVMIIIGVLCAIAIPQFTQQTTKGVDVQAKELVRTAETTAEVIGTDEGGKYTNVTKEALHSAEPSIPIVRPASGGAYVSAANGTASGYAVTVTASNGDELTISRAASGAIVRSCHAVSQTGCADGNDSSW